MTDQDIIDQALTILEERLKQPEHCFTNPADAMAYLKLQCSELEYESFQAMFLNTKHGMIELKELFRGTIDSAVVYPREVIKAALHFNAAAVILAHNHPSGDSKPSHADKAITERLKKALNLVDIRVLDHVIVGSDKSYSFAEHGLL